MWLLDANVPIQLVALLKELGIEAESAISRGWNTLSNGALVKAAVEAEFTTLLTRDRLFGESAAQALKLHVEFSIVRISLPQLRARVPSRVSRGLAWSIYHTGAGSADGVAD